MIEAKVYEKKRAERDISSLGGWGAALNKVGRASLGEEVQLNKDDSKN